MTCGIVFAKYKGPQMSAAPNSEPVTHSAPSLPANQEPEPDFTDGVWQRGRTLIVSRLATLPDRCVSCNEPSEARLTRKLSWHKGWVYAFLLVNLLVYAVVAMIVRKQAAIEVPQCAHHAKIRRYGFLGAWGLMGLGCLLAWASAGSLADADGAASAAPIFIFLAAALVSLIFGFTVSRPVVARRIDDEFVWLGKCSKSFLESLPEAPSSI
jgi:hypothetical protein